MTSLTGGSSISSSRSRNFMAMISYTNEHVNQGIQHLLESLLHGVVSFILLNIFLNQRHILNYQHLQ